jgi:hypothetical protein
VATDRAGRDAQFVGSAADAAQPGSDFEGPQGVEQVQHDRCKKVN